MRQSFRQGFYRFKPDGTRMEFVRNTNNNSWGVGFSEEGLVFGSTANGNPSEHMPLATLDEDLQKAAKKAGVKKFA